MACIYNAREHSKRLLVFMLVLAICAACLAQGKEHGLKTAGGHDLVCRNSLFLASAPAAVGASLSEAKTF